MGIPVLVLGESGTGKSASLRNFQPGEVAIINVVNKPLPFRTKLKTYNTDDYAKVAHAMTHTQKKAIVIDDAQYLMANEFMRNAKVQGYQKFTDMALNFYNLIRMIPSLPDDVIVYVMAHIERGADGNEKMKTIGKMLDEKITMEGLFTVVLKTHVEDGKYLFSTRNSGMDTVKTPIGMFDGEYIENDLKMVDKTAREYYDLTNLKEDNKND